MQKSADRREEGVVVAWDEIVRWGNSQHGIPRRRPSHRPGLPTQPYRAPLKTFFSISKLEIVLLFQEGIEPL